MAPFWNDARRCLRLSDRCSGLALASTFTALLLGIFDAPWVLLLTSMVLTLRANRLFRSESRDGR